MTSKTELLTLKFFRYFILEIVLILILLEFPAQKIFPLLSKKFEIFFLFNFLRHSLRKFIFLIN